jgi:hypothetical protein
MDCHLNTSLQYALLEEIVTRWIPDSSQLWTASHALGFIDYAYKSKNASVIDFDLLDFDVFQELQPVIKDQIDVYEVAIPKKTIKDILKGYKLVIVENKNDEYFNSILGQEGFLFLPAQNNREVFLTAKQDGSKFGLRDRDYLRSDEIEKIKTKLPNLKILHLYGFENYAYHPDNIAEINPDGFDVNLYKTEITKQKNERLLQIVDEVAEARQHYVEFKDYITDDKNRQPIIDALQSNDFEVFYPMFNMKKFNKSYLKKFQLHVSDLVKTKWFKTQIKAILNS